MSLMLALGANLPGVIWGHINLIISALRPLEVSGYAESTWLRCPVALGLQMSRATCPLTRGEWHIFPGLADP